MMHALHCVFVVQIQSILKRKEVDDMLLLHLENLMAKPEGMMLAMVGLTPETLVPLVQPMVHVSSNLLSTWYCIAPEVRCVLLSL